MEKQFQEENEYLKTLLELEDLAQKKASVYARLLMEPSLASQMEALATRHLDRKKRIEKLLYGKAEGEKNEA